MDFWEKLAIYLAMVIVFIGIFIYIYLPVKIISFCSKCGMKTERFQDTKQECPYCNRDYQDEVSRKNPDGYNLKLSIDSSF